MDNWTQIYSATICQLIYSLTWLPVKVNINDIEVIFFDLNHKFNSIYSGIIYENLLKTYTIRQSSYFDF